MEKEIIFKLGVDASSGERSINEMEQELVNAKKASVGFTEKLDELKKKVDSGTLSMRETTKVVKEYQTIALNAGRETPIGQYAIKQAGALTDKLGDLRNEINRAGQDGKHLQGAMQISSSVVAGYGAVQGIMALTGSESEELTKTLVKLSAVQSILSGIEQIRLSLEKESLAVQTILTAKTKVLTAVQYVYSTAVGTTTGVMKALRLAMLALPIVAIIAGIVGLVSWLSQLGDETEDLEKKNDALTKSYESQSSALDRAISKRKRASENTIELMKAQGASVEEIHKAEMKALKSGEAERKTVLASEINHYQSRLEMFKKFQKEGDHEKAKEIQAELKQTREKIQGLRDLDGQYQHDKNVAEVNLQKTLLENAEKGGDKIRESKSKGNENEGREQEEADKRKLEEQKIYEDLVIANIQNQNQREIAELALKHKREIEETKAKYGDKSKVVAEMEAQQVAETMALIDAQDEAFKKAEEDKDSKEKEGEKARVERDRLDKKSQLEADLLNLYKDFEAGQAVKTELAELDRDWALENEKLTAGEKEKIEADYQKKIRDLKDETKEHDKKIMQEALDTVTKSLSSAQNLTDVYFSIKKSKVDKDSREGLALAKKQFQVQKSMQLAMATIDGFKAVTASLAQSPIAIGVVPNPVGIASLAFAVTSSLANIAKIASTKFEGGSSGGLSSVSPPSTSAPTETTVTPPAGGTATGSLAGANQTQVILVDSDIKAMAHKVEVAERLSKFP